MGNFRPDVVFRNPGEIAQYEFTFLLVELVLYTMALLSFLHARRQGARYFYLWWAALAHGLMVELLSYLSDDIDNFWHAQSMIMFFARREPLHIILFYPAFIYLATVAVLRMNLRESVQPFAVGLMVVLLDVPWDIMGIKLLWWTWHDTDSNIFDRNYWVPWTSYMFHATFASSFCFIYNGSRRWFTGLSGTYSLADIERMPYTRKVRAQNTWGEVRAMLLTAMCSMPLGALQFQPAYHWPRDILKVPTEVCVFILAGVYFAAALWGVAYWNPRNLREEGEREEGRGAVRAARGQWHWDELVLSAMVHYFFYIALVLTVDPAKIVAVGEHQAVGPCDHETVIKYSYNKLFPGYMDEVVIGKKTYLCRHDYDEAYFNFNCPQAGGPPAQDLTTWYPVCGTPYENHAEYVIIVVAASLIGLAIYVQVLCYPRSLREVLRDMLFKREFPRYYHVSEPQTAEHWKAYRGSAALAQPAPLAEILERRVSASTGGFEYRVRWGGDGAGNDGAVEAWEEREELLLDGSGAHYGERGGLYGQFWADGPFGGSGTRERLRVFDDLENAKERLRLGEEKQENKAAAAKGGRGGAAVEGSAAATASACGRQKCTSLFSYMNAASK